LTGEKRFERVGTNIGQSRKKKQKQKLI